MWPHNFNRCTCSNCLWCKKLCNTTSCSPGGSKSARYQSSESPLNRALAPTTLRLCVSVPLNSAVYEYCVRVSSQLYSKLFCNEKVAQEFLRYNQWVASAFWHIHWGVSMYSCSWQVYKPREYHSTTASRIFHNAHPNPSLPLTLYSIFKLRFLSARPRRTFPVHLGIERFSLASLMCLLTTTSMSHHHVSTLSVAICHPIRVYM